MSTGDAESSEVLIEYLEQVSGRKLRSREDIRRYVQEISSRTAAPPRAPSLLITLKQGMWLTLLVVAYLQFYLLDIMNRMYELPEIRVNLPAVQMQHKEHKRI